MVIFKPLSPQNCPDPKQVYRRGQLPLKEGEQVKRPGRDNQYLTHYTKALTSPPFFKEGIKGRFEGNFLIGDNSNDNDF